jgi:hypothetical protein
MDSIDYENRLYDKHMIELEYIIINEQAYSFYFTANRKSPLLLIALLLEDGTLLKQSVLNSGKGYEVIKKALKRKIQTMVRRHYFLHKILPHPKHYNVEKTNIYCEIMQKINDKIK